jgi:hypothetical protein
LEDNFGVAVDTCIQDYRGIKNPVGGANRCASTFLIVSYGSEQVSLGAPKDSRNHCGCFAFMDQATHLEPLVEIHLEEFFAILRFEQRNKLAQLGYQEILGKRGTQLGLIWAGK